MKTDAQGRQKLAKGIALGLVLGTTLGISGVASAQTYYVYGVNNIQYTLGSTTYTTTLPALANSSGDTFIIKSSVELAFSTYNITPANVTATGSGSSITMNNANDKIIANGAATVDGIYTEDSGTASMTGGTISITKTTTKADGVHAVGGSTITLKNLGANFTVDAVDGGSATGVEAYGTGTTVTVSGTDLNKITSDNNIAVGLTGSNSAKINFTVDENNTSKEIIVAAREYGTASGILANDSAVNTVQNVTNTKVSSARGNAYGIRGSNSGTNNYDVGLKAQGTLTVTAGEKNANGGQAWGIAAEGGGVNNVAGLTSVDVEGTKDADGILALSGKNNIAMDGDLTVQTNESSDISNGVVASYGGQNVINGVKDISVNVITSGDAHGVFATAFSTTFNKINADVAIGTEMGSITATTKSGKACGIEADYAAYNTVGGVTSITVTASADAAGIVAYDTNSVNTVYMDSTITVTSTTKGTATGIIATNKATNTVTGVTEITVDNQGIGDAYGICAYTNGTVKVYQIDGKSVVPVTAENTGTGDATGALATENSTIENIGDVTATANSGSAYGVVLGSGTNTIKTVNNIKATTTSGNQAVGIKNYLNGNNTLDVSGNVEATNNGEGAAVAVSSTSTGDTTVTVKGTTSAEAPAGDAAITNAVNTGAITLNANGALTATGKRAGGANSSFANTTTINGNGNSLTLKGTQSSAAVLVKEGATVNLNKLKIDSKAPDGKAYSAFAYDTKGATVNLTDTTIASSTTENNAADIAYQNGSSVAGQDLVINIDGTSSITGAANVIDDTGATNSANDSASLGAIKINNAGTWNVTGDSNLNATGAGSLTNTGYVDMTKDGTTATTQSFSTMQVNSLTNNGQLVMDVSPKNTANGDQIVTTIASGSGTIKANILASEVDAAGKDFLESKDPKSANPLIKVLGTNNANFIVTNNGNNNLELGNFTYSLQPYVYTDANGNKVTGYWLVNNSLLSNKGTTVVRSIVSPDYWYYETNALYTDMNNFTNARKEHDVWAHAVHNKTTINDAWSGTVADDVNSDVDTQYNGVVFGIDKKFSQNKRGTFWGGILGGYGKGSNDFTGGDADTDSAHIGIYGVYRTSTNWYVGSILKYNRYSTDIKSTTAAGSAGGVHTSDDMSQNGWGISVISGKRFMNNKGWFVEPQLEFGYHSIGGGEYTLGGEHVDVDAMTSKRLRAGINFGKSFVYKSGANLDVFAQASIVREFGADTEITTYNSYLPNNGTDSFDTDYGGSWGLYKLGVNYNTPRGNNAIFALTYRKGGHRSSPVGVELTYNWTF